MIKAIETRYAGCRFRSRAEARWAVFFDALGIKWEYEKEGFELPSGRYLPDFWLPHVQVGCWFEVKGQEPTEREKTLARELAEGSGFPVYIFTGELRASLLDVGLEYHFGEKRKNEVWDLALKKYPEIVQRWTKETLWQFFMQEQKQSGGLEKYSEYLLKQPQGVAFFPPFQHPVYMPELGGSLLARLHEECEGDYEDRTGVNWNTLENYQKGGRYDGVVFEGQSFGICSECKNIYIVGGGSKSNAPCHEMKYPASLARQRRDGSWWPAMPESRWVPASRLDLMSRSVLTSFQKEILNRCCYKFPDYGIENMKKLESAFIKAASARFEFGENG